MSAENFTVPDVSWVIDWLFPPENQVRRKWSEDELRALIRDEFVNMTEELIHVIGEAP